MQLFPDRVSSASTQEGHKRGDGEGDTETQPGTKTGQKSKREGVFTHTSKL